jgi:hypothetical protein
MNLLVQQHPAAGALAPSGESADLLYEFAAKVDGLDARGCDLLTDDGNGKINEFPVIVPQ